MLNLLSAVVNDLPYSSLCYFVNFFRSLTSQLESQTIQTFHGLIDSVSTGVGEIISVKNPPCCFLLSRPCFLFRYFRSLSRFLFLTLVHILEIQQIISKMKCLCCDSSFADQESLKDHYVDLHNVDENNHFFRKLFTRDNVFVAGKYFRCDHFRIKRRDEQNHIFLSHYRWLTTNGRQASVKKHFW